MNDIAYIEKTLPRVIDKVFRLESRTEILMGENYIKLDFLDAKTVKVTKLKTSGLTKYERGGYGKENKKGNVISEHENFTLSQERQVTIDLDKLDTLDDGETVLGAMAREVLETQVVPEFDTYRFSAIASHTNTFFGNRVEETIADDEIISKLNAAFEFLAESQVPNENQVIFVNPAIMNKIRSTKELYRKLSQSEYKDNVSFSIEKYEGREIVEVPSDRFYTDAVFADGYYPSKDSKVINFMVVDKKSPIIIRRLAEEKIYSSDTTDLGFTGYRMRNVYYHDCFVPENKEASIYCSVSTTKATERANKLLVKAVAGSSLNTKITLVQTQPAGKLWTELRNVTDGTIPAIGAASGALGTPIELNKDFVPNGTNNVIIACHDNKVVAVSKNFGKTLPKGA